MKILYGVVGEGMGHAMRSRVVLEHLVAEGHEIEVMASGRAVDFLGRHFAGVRRIHGLHMVYADNRVDRSRTALSNLQASFKGVPANIAAYFELIDRFDPELVISDFESWTHLYAKAHGLPIVSIDNMQILNRCKLPKDVIAGHEAAFRLTRAFVKAKLPRCDHYLITTFFRPPLRKKRTTLVPPILRREILEVKRSRGDHLLVYQTGEGYAALLEALKRTGLECRLYGVRRDLEQEVAEDNLRFMPFSEAGFIADLASCRAVIAGGGFTLMGEAVYLHKPMLSVPLGMQFEQVLNSRYLEREGYGLSAPALDDPEVVERFIAGLPRYQQALERYGQPGNAELFEALDGLLDRAAAGLLG